MDLTAPAEPKLTSKGYVLQYRPQHVAADRNGYVLEHRLVMEEYLGKPLLPGEVVHHRDRKRANNPIANLLLCPSDDLHSQLHLMMRSKNQRLVHELEHWFAERMEQRRAENQPRLPMAAEGKKPPEPAAEPAIPAVVAVVEQLRGIANKEERGRCLEAILAAVDRRELARTLGQRLETADLSERLRLLWTLGELRCDEAAAPLMRLLREPGPRNLRIALYSALSKGKLAGVPPDEIAAAAVKERGQSLQYAIKAVVLYCPSELAQEVLDRIGEIPDPDYTRDALERSIRAGRRALRKATAS